MKKITSKLARIHPLVAFGMLGLLSVSILSSGVYLYLTPQLPNVEQLREIKLETPLQIYSRDEKLSLEKSIVALSATMKYHHF